MLIDITKKELQIKKKHHYIWRHYLDQWSTNNKVFYISKSGKIASDSAKGLSCEKGFYKTHPLSREDTDFIIIFSKMSPELLHKVHMKFLKNFINISKKLHVTKALKLESPEVQHLEKVLTFNTLEKMHTDIETKALPILHEFWDGNLDVFQENDHKVAFCSYVGHQITRTKSFKEMAFSIFDLDDFYSEKFPNYKALFERNWWFLSFILGINIGSSIIADSNSKHLFIKNNSEVPFVTSDNPAINIHPTLANLEEWKDPKQMDLFYPLSPHLAYMVNESNNYDKLAHSVSSEDVIKLNQMVALKADKTIFSNSEKTLKDLKKFKAHNTPNGDNAKRGRTKINS